jgi:hypothetical protein
VRRANVTYVAAMDVHTTGSHLDRAPADIAAVGARR